MDYVILNKDNLDEYVSKLFTHNDEKINYRYVSNCKGDTIFLAKCFAKYLKKSDVININGKLGAGKTVFMSGIASYFNIESQVSSPTFTIVNEYDIQQGKIYHFDVYRLEDSDEFLDAIGTDYFENGICIIEWGNIIQDILPNNTIHIDIDYNFDNENERIFSIRREF